MCLDTGILYWYGSRSLQENHRPFSICPFQPRAEHRNLSINQGLFTTLSERCLNTLPFRSLQKKTATTTTTTKQIKVFPRVCACWVGKLPPSLERQMLAGERFYIWASLFIHGRMTEFQEVGRKVSPKSLPWQHRWLLGAENRDTFPVFFRATQQCLRTVYFHLWMPCTSDRRCQHSLQLSTSS